MRLWDLDKGRPEMVTTGRAAGSTGTLEAARAAGTTGAAGTLLKGRAGTAGTTGMACVTGSMPGACVMKISARALSSMQ